MPREYARSNILAFSVDVPIRPTGAEQRDKLRHEAEQWHRQWLGDPRRDIKQGFAFVGAWTVGFVERPRFDSRDGRWVHLPGQREKAPTLMYSGWIDVPTYNPADVTAAVVEEISNMIEVLATIVSLDLNGPHPVRVSVGNDHYRLTK